MRRHMQMGQLLPVESTRFQQILRVDNMPLHRGKIASETRHIIIIT